jgi:gliding motility-associated-like protein
LFVFYQPGTGVEKGSLTASLPDQGNYNFDWSQYDPGTSAFLPYSSESGVQRSTLSDLDEGGYRVRIWNGTGTDTTFLAWVMLNNLHAELEQTNDRKVKPFKYTCDFLVISGSVTIDSFYYYDPVSHTRIPLENEYHFRYTSDNPDLDIPNDSTVLDPNITYLPPVLDTWYILTARDDLGMTVIDSVLYESIHTRAEFTVEYYDKKNEVYDPGLTGSWDKETGSLDALLTVKFLNESVNGASFEWVYIDTVGIEKESEFTYDLETEPEYTFKEADHYYYPYMVSISEADCRDTFRLEEPIYVQPSQLIIPNVFSPNNDGMNDVWEFKHQSLKSCKLTIIDRFGKVVYKKQINDIYAWDGWDGNILNSNRRAPEGQYYFVIEAIGYDGKEFRDPNILEKRKANKNDNQGSNNQDEEQTQQGRYTGWLYLFRGSGNF